MDLSPFPACESYRWSDEGWRGVAREELVVYELHVGAFTPEGTFAAIVPRLPELRRLACGLLLLSPCVPLLFMGEEYGQRRPFPFFCSFGDPQLIEAVRRGRREEFAAMAFRWKVEPMGSRAQ